MGTLFGCDNKETNPEPFPEVKTTMSIPKYVTFHLLDNHSQWLTAIQYAGLTTIDKKGILDEDKHTILLPSDKDLLSLPEAIFNVENKALLTRLLRYHIINTDYNRLELLQQQELVTMDNNTKVIVDNGMLKTTHTDTQRINTSEITNTSEYKADNGYIYLISNILIPEHLEGQIEALKPPTETE